MFHRTKENFTMENLDFLNIAKQDITNVWNPERFSIQRKPIYVGTVNNKEAFSSLKVSCLDMLIKLPNGEIKIPYYDKNVNEVVQRCVDFEKTINPNWENYYLYLTMDPRSVTEGKTQRREGAHFDGMQGAIYKQKLPGCHSYIVSSKLPTKFYLQPFDARDLDENLQNWFFELGKQTLQEKSFYPEPFDIYFMSCYQVHESVKADKNLDRTFMRVEFSLKKFNRIGDTINPLIYTGWKFINRDIPSHLITISTGLG